MIRALTFSLALLIAVTSQHMAMARGMAKDASGQVILCTGQGPVTVTLDASGKPMGVVHICPDCALSLIAHLDVPKGGVSPLFRMSILTQTPVLVSQNSPINRFFAARGPPSFV